MPNVALVHREVCRALLLALILLAVFLVWPRQLGTMIIRNRALIEKAHKLEKHSWDTGWVSRRPGGFRILCDFFLCAFPPAPENH